MIGPDVGPTPAGERLARSWVSQLDPRIELYFVLIFGTGAARRDEKKAP